MNITHYIPLVIFYYTFLYIYIWVPSLIAMIYLAKSSTNKFKYLVFLYLIPMILSTAFVDYFESQNLLTLHYAVVYAVHAVPILTALFLYRKRRLPNPGNL
jgi:hypothetical protein